jgi:XTP/dITP diphosphohydrolase
MKICFATHNQHKASEIRKLLPRGFELITLDDLNQIEEIPETGQTLAENSALKAQYVFQKFGKSCFADDTGLEVVALNGEPGVYSARYAGEQKDNEANINLVLKKLRNQNDRAASFKTIITYIDESGLQMQFTGQVQGEIINEKTGNSGFGYDPVFKPSGFEKTFAQMTGEEKNAISHRGRAFRQFFDFLNNQTKK